MHTPEKKPEILLTCPVCKQPGFTLEGLGAHRCKAQAREKLSLKNIQLAIRAASGLGVPPSGGSPSTAQPKAAPGIACKMCGLVAGDLWTAPEGGLICTSCKDAHPCFAPSALYAPPRETVFSPIHS